MLFAIDPEYLDETGPCRYLISVAEEILIAPGETPKKLANVLKKRFPTGYVRKLFRKRGVRLNGNRCKPDVLVHPGDRIQLYIPFAQASKPNRQSARARSELEIIYEDRDLVVINKPAGSAAHEGKEVLRRHSVLGKLESRYRPEGVTPRLVHRLDKDTSGVLLVAKTETAANQLEECFANEKVDKQYVCLLVGRLQENQGALDFPLPGRTGKPVHALTRFRVIKRFPETTLVRVKIATGRMHQIRLHFAKYGYPVVMDDQHGDFAFNKQFRKKVRLRRQFLHASSLTLEYRGKKRTWTASLPADLAETLECLEAR
jgi:23S rRNA pseudouridine955/2504/2580 synthase